MPRTTQSDRQYERAERAWSNFDEANLNLDISGAPAVAVLESWPNQPITVDQYGSSQITLNAETASTLGRAILRALNTSEVRDSQIELRSNSRGEYIVLQVGRARQTYYFQDARILGEMLIRASMRANQIRAGLDSGNADDRPEAA